MGGRQLSRFASNAVSQGMQMVTPWCPDREMSYFLDYDGNEVIL